MASSEAHGTVGFTQVLYSNPIKAALAVPPEGGPGLPSAALDCAEIKPCVGCTRQFFCKSFLSDDAAVRTGSSGEERNRIATPSSRRRVDGVEDDTMIQHERAVKF